MPICGWSTATEFDRRRGAARVVTRQGELVVVTEWRRLLRAAMAQAAAAQQGRGR
jgi:hypothetical protein